MRIVKDPLMKFDSHFPIYNWYYPIPREFYPPDKQDARPVPLGDFFSAAIPRRGALYVHIPFCETICTFCPFVRAKFSGPDTVERYVGALLGEIALKAPAATRSGIDFRAVNFGGGTPSVLSAEQLLRLGGALRASFDLGRIEEFSFECEVKSVTAQKMAALKRIGVTRITFGVQTFQPLYRELFNLTPTIAQVREAMALMRLATDRLGFDMLYGFHGQTMEDLIDDLRQAVSLGANNINVFPISNLRIQPVLHKRFAERGMKPVSAAGKFVMRMFADQYLRHAGYRPCNGHSYIMAPGAPADAVTIEPDNYLYSSILNGHHDDVYVGLGSGAYTYTHSHIATNEAGREKYVEDAAAGGDAILASPVPPDVAAGRSLILRLPYNGRLSREKIDFGHADRRQLDQLRLFIDEGLVEERPGEYRLTKAGWYWYVNLMFAFHPPEIRKMAHDFVAGIVARAEKQGIACDGDMRILPEADRSLLFSIG